MMLPTAIRATLVMSGMLGLRFGFQSGGGGGESNTIEAQVPFNITVENQSLFEVSATPLPKLSEKPLNKVTLLAEKVGSSTRKSAVRGTRQALGFQLSGFKINTDFAEGNKCGPGSCHEDFTCVSWVQIKNVTDERESLTMLHECLKKEGDYSKKINPSSGTLCGAGEIHSIIHYPQPCLKDDPPCPLIWKYKCIQLTGKDANESGGDINSCVHKQCPVGSICREVNICGDEPPCIPVAECR